jgi:hypothetical protein
MVNNDLDGGRHRAVNPRGGRRRAVNPPIGKISPPDLGGTNPPHPEVAKRIANGAATVPFVGVQGKRAWAYGYQRIKPGNGLKWQYSFKNQSLTPGIWLVFEVCKGECDSLQALWLNGSRFPATANEVHFTGVDCWWYPGTVAGNVDSHLAAVDTSWNEAFPGTCHAVMHLYDLDKQFPQFPAIEFEQKCYKPIDPETGTRVYTENPGPQWYDWLIDPEGKNLPTARVNTASFVTLKHISDEAVGLRKRFQSHLLLGDATSQDDVINTFRLMTDSYYYSEDENGQVRVVCDRPGSPAATYGDSNMSTTQELQLSPGDDLERPNSIFIVLTDTANNFKTKRIGPFKSAGLLAGTEDELQATYQMPFIHDEGCATSRGKYLVNSYQYNLRLTVPWNETTSDRVLGDIVTQNIPARNLAFTGRLIARTKTLKKNVYVATLVLYNAARYSDDTTTSPSKVPSITPQPGEVPTGATGITLSPAPPRYLGPTDHLTLTYTTPATPFFEALEIYIEYSSDGGASYGTKTHLADAQTSPFTLPMFPSSSGTANAAGLYRLTFVARTFAQQRSTGVVQTYQVNAASFGAGFVLSGMAQIDAGTTGNPSGIAATSPGISDAARFFGFKNGTSESLFMTTNSIWTGSVWNRDDVSKVAWRASFDGDAFGIYRAAAGANPITWPTPLLTLDNSGNVGIGGTPSNLLHIHSGATPATSQLRIQANQLGSLSALSFAADNQSIGFDVDFASSSWVARNATVAWLYKSGGLFQIMGSGGNTVGGVATQNLLVTVNLTTGHMGIGGAPTARMHVFGVNATLSSQPNLAIVTTDAQAIDKGGALGLSGLADVEIEFARLVGRKENATLNNRDGYFAVSTFVGGVGLVERMRISSTGMVIIGSDLSPFAKLTVNAGAATTFTNNPASISALASNTFAANMGGGMAFGGFYTASLQTVFGYVGGVKENATSGDYGGKLLFGTRVNGSGGEEMTRASLSSLGAWTYTAAAATGTTQLFTGTTTAHHVLQVLNAGGSLQVGVDDSTGSLSGTAYSGMIRNLANTPLKFMTNNTLRATLSELGAWTYTAAAATPTIHLFGGTTTAYNTLRLTNTTGDMFVGVENSAGGGILAGTTAYAGLIAVAANKPLHLGTNNLLRATLDELGHLKPSTVFSYDLGTNTLRWRALYASELRVETLVAQKTIATIGGRILVGPTTKLTADVAAAATTITVEDNQITIGDTIYLESAPGGVQQVEFMAVTAGPTGTGPYAYTVTRNLDATGANDWQAGDAVFNTGTTGSGFIDLYSVRGTKASTELGPTIVGNVRNSATFNDWTPRWAIGNLNGLYGYSSNTYGVAMGVPTAAWVKIDPTDGVRIGHNTTTKIQLDAAGNASFTGSVTAASGSIAGWTISSTELVAPSGSAIRSGQTAYDTGTGFFLGNVAGTPKFSIGNSAGNKLTWDGSALAITGTLTSTTGTIGGWTLGATSLTSGSGATTVGLDSGGTNPAFYAGSATPSAAPFRVTNAGALTASNATITGAVTATSGAIGGWTISSGAIIGSLGTTSEIKIGASGYNSGTGFFVGNVGGAAKLSIGSSTGNRLTWDGSVLTLNGIVASANWSVTAAGFLTCGDINASNIACANANAATSFKIADTKVIGAQGLAVADANGTLASVNSQLNALLARVRAATGHGLIA